ncbi:MAG: hypothetical protein IJ511_10965 [Bacteroides sp.]|nr:hypothetical protein [Bacteroides sp.]
MFLSACCIAALMTCTLSHPVEIERVVAFIENHREEVADLERQLGKEESLMALAIVAPEISHYRQMLDMLEIRTLCLLYVQQGVGDFSIGPFQMKPSFAEHIEREVDRNSLLRERFGKLLITEGTPREKRRTRIERLIEPGWQTSYLAAFICLVRESTQEVAPSTPEATVAYWATLYNAGMDLTQEAVKKKQSLKEFPRMDRKYNYAELAVGYYKFLIKR